MALTGYMISVYEDVNPYSPTYGQTRTEREQDTNECTPPSSGDWRIIYDYCEIVDLDYTGYLISVYQDVDQNSPTYGERLERRSYDEITCPLDSNVPIWELIDTYCEQVAYQPSGRLGNTGYKIEEWRDANEYSDTYNQVEHRRIPDTVNCEVPDTNDIWVIQSETCHQVDNGSGIMVNDGTKIIVRVETNEYSPNYNFGQSETITVEDLENCPLAETSPDWVEQTYTCVLDEGYRTGDIIIVEEDVNPLSSTYGQQRTRTERDTNRCPVQPKPQPVNMPYRIINNRSIATDTITSISVAFNSDVTITSTSMLYPAGGVITGTYSLSDTKKNVDLTISSVTATPNASQPTNFQYGQTPRPYNWTNSGGATLTIILTDGDGTAPIWYETGYSCEQSGGENTGNAIVTETDINPDSSTYETTRTRTVQNDPRCPVDTSANWVELSYICELSNGFNTGNSISTQEDTNPNSPTYGSTRNILIENDTTRCPLSSAAAWTEVSYECEQQDGVNTGRAIITERDVNPGSSTYNQTRTRTVSDDARCVSNPIWVEVSYVCEQITTTPDWVATGYTCEVLNGEYTGNKIVTETDENPYSSTYGQTRTTTVQDTTMCPAAPVYHFKVKTVSSGGTETTVRCNSDTKLHQSEVTNSNCVSAIVGDCVDFINGFVFDGWTRLREVILSNSLNGIGSDAFRGCTSLTEITIPSSVTVINRSFRNCTGLTSVTCLATTPPVCSYNPFENTNPNLVIYVPADSLIDYKEAEGWSDYASRIQAIPNS